MFVHSRDIDGKSILIMKSKKHIKGQKNMDDLKRCTIYWFERLQRWVHINFNNLNISNSILLECYCFFYCPVEFCPICHQNNYGCEWQLVILLGTCTWQCVVFYIYVFLSYLLSLSHSISILITAI